MHRENEYEKMSLMKEQAKLIAREAVFRMVCRHEQGSRPNILLFCARRGGSTWVLNTVAAHKGMRYVSRPFMTVLESRWRHKVPCLKKAASYTGSKNLRQIIRFNGEDEEHFRSVAKNIIDARWHIYPSINFRAPYFNRRTDRVIFQMTSGLPMINWFEANFDVNIVYLVRHPIPNAVSIMREGWEPECHEFLENAYFRDSFLNSQQVDFAKKIESGDNLLARHVLDWSLKHLVPLREIRKSPLRNWLCLSYEDLVLHPQQVINKLASSLDLNDVDSMRRQIERPSRTVTSSTSKRVEDKSYLLSRWRKKVSSVEESSLMKILDVMELDIYTTGRDTPKLPLFCTNE